ncbi:porin family protein [Vibrio maerlii]|uniref:porin family protein n=1 Tax=Vibrio maerlii TaxID=2231648 RepID=UPI000E3D56F6|nr:porin family protein [Vibrio maerlii]
MKQPLLPALIALAFTPLTHAEIFVTPSIGYTIGGEVSDQFDNNYDIKGAESYGIALETTLSNGRIGLFYSTQSSDVEEIKASVSTHYLHFQSSLYYPLERGFSGLFGLGIGASYIDAKWVDDNVGFSASIFGGLAYKINDTLSLQGQLRWLGTVVDNDTTSICNLPTQDQSCLIRFDTDWMNQFQTNLGLTYRF